MELPERARLAGEIYAHQQEAVDLRARASTMYIELERLRGDNRVLLIRSKEADAREADLTAAANRAAENFEAAVRRANSLEEELGVLRAVSPKASDVEERQRMLDTMNQQTSDLQVMRDLRAAAEKDLTVALAQVSSLTSELSVAKTKVADLETALTAARAVPPT
jgi:chromosome segregation ATPase